MSKTKLITDSWLQVMTIEDIPVLGARVIQAAVGPIAVFRNSENEIFAILDKCPHKGGPLSQGIVHGKSVTCPLHSWNIELSSGCAASPDEGCTQSFQIKVEKGVIWLQKTEILAVHE